MLRLAICQMTSVDDVQRNLESMKSILSKVEKSSEDTLICFPENCLYMRCEESEQIVGLTLDDVAINELSRIAKEQNFWIHLGALPLRDESGLFNASVIISNKGAVNVGYRKMHLFDIQLENSRAIRESDVFNYGSNPEIFEIGPWRIGQSICYDLRFSDLYLYYANQEVDLILVPAAFLVKTGQAHWEILLRARAIESQAYVAASAQAGEHIGLKGGKKFTYGHSLLVDPWGQVLMDLPADTSVSVFRLEKKMVDSVRKQIPMKDHRRHIDGLSGKANRSK